MITKLVQQHVPGGTAQFRRPTIFGWGLVGVAAISIVAALFLCIGFATKEYNRYQRIQDAQNELAAAEYDKKIQVEDALGQKLAAVQLAQVEVERAKGVAEANNIIAGSLNEEYLRYFYISQLSKVENAGGRIIYVPTEAGLPILEAGRGK